VFSSPAISPMKRASRSRGASASALATADPSNTRKLSMNR